MHRKSKLAGLEGSKGSDRQGRYQTAQQTRVCVCFVCVCVCGRTERRRCDTVLRVWGTGSGGWWNAEKTGAQVLIDRTVCPLKFDQCYLFIANTSFQLVMERTVPLRHTLHFIGWKPRCSYFLSILVMNFNCASGCVAVHGMPHALFILYFN